MSKKIILGILLPIFSTGTINSHVSWTEKVTPIKQRVKNSIKKVTLKDALDYTFKAAVVVIGVAWVVERRHRKTQVNDIYKSLNKQFFTFNNLVNQLEKEIKPKK